MPGECPACGFVALTVMREVEHMELVHPQTVVDRLEAAGEHDEAREFRERVMRDAG